MSVRWTAWWLVGALVAASCASGSPPQRQILLGGEPMRTCTVAAFEARCGTLRVPEDPMDPVGRWIDLSVVVIPASGTPAPDPVFFLAGGPGGAATENWAGAPGTFEALHAARDIVLVDQRGTGDSGLLLGPELPQPSNATVEDLRRIASRWVDEALADADVDVRRYGSMEAAADIDAVRRALGAERIDLYGGSYGATLA
jgi:pimeloyl-ACP methyl ester carboxylesterase